MLRTFILFLSLCIFACNSDQTIDLHESQAEHSLYSDNFFTTSPIKASLVESNMRDIDDPTLRKTTTQKTEMQSHTSNIQKSLPERRPKKELMSAKSYTSTNGVASDKEIVQKHLGKIIGMVFTDRYISPSFDIKSSSLNNTDIIYVNLNWSDRWKNTYRIGGKLTVRPNNTLYFEILEQNLNVEALEFTEENYMVRAILGKM